ncbi:c-type cytochrome biogenesis protein CcsB [Jongsikchunia kroppenstedtii]|uniref:c-type cytochrome biogenesis protein CcsB n=1 Tax=Jongsikchunia kroppenstedtii TaxID=1121721 RepID=UPI000362DE62|nr:c-type cytochrome biogenesis protein CcsB [Jongsikchunia kroppenstedtii]
MNVNENLARLSDLSFGTAITIYILAMVLLLAALAGQRQRKLAAADARQAELVGAAVGGPATAPPADDRTPGKLAPQERRSRGEQLAKMGYAVVMVGALVHITSIVLRGLATHRAPWGNMYEFISITCAAGVVAGIVALRKPQQRPLLSFLLVPVTLLMFIGGEFLYTQAAPVVPALKSYWLAIHVSIISLGSGIFMVSGVASILYLVKMRVTEPPADKFWGRILDRLPDAAALDRIAYKTVIVGFPLFGLGVICGAIWAESAWGRFWGWDPKETVSFIAWVVYAAYLHARATAGWRNQSAAWINVAGFVAMLFNLFIINLVVSGLHSYAGLN